MSDIRRWITLCEAIETLPAWLMGNVYHGTARRRLAFSDTHVAYFTESLSMAWQHADMDSQVEGGTPRVLRVKLSVRKPAHMNHMLMQDLHLPEHKALVARLQAEGYDCALGDGEDDHGEICVFSRNDIQIQEIMEKPLTETVFTTAPLKHTIFGNNHAPWAAFESEQPVTIYYRPSRSEMLGLLKTSRLRTVITADEVYIANSHDAAHAGMRSVLEDYGVNLTGCLNTIITGPNRMTYAWGKYLPDDPESRRWRMVRQTILDHPRIKIMFPQGLVIVRDDWT